MIYAVSALAGFAYGCLFCWFNHRILQYAVNKYNPTEQPQKSAAAVMKAYGLRYLLSFVALVLMVFIAKLLPLHFITAVVAAAIGLTLPSQIWHIKNDRAAVNTANGNSEFVSKSNTACEPEKQPPNEGDWQEWESWDDDSDD